MKLNKSISLESLAKMLNADFDGNADFQITGINEIHKVENGDITFVDHPKYYVKALKSAASVVIINKKVEEKYGKHLIFSDDPFRDYVAIVKHYTPFVSCNNIVSNTAVIGKNTVIQLGAFVGNNVTIGDNCIIHANVSIYDNCVLGNNVIIHSNTVIGGDAFYYKRRPEGYDKLESCGRTVIEDNVEIGCNCTIDKGVSADTIIGKGSKLDNHIQIGHDTVLGNNCLICSQVGIAGMVTLEDDVILWGQVGVQKDLVIGKGAIVLAQSGVSKTIEGGKVYFGSPASENMTKLREMAALRQLPDFMQKILNDRKIEL